MSSRGSGRPAAIASDAARPLISGGKSSAAILTLMPMPMTIWLMASISADISVRMPTSFLPSQRISLGHLMPQATPVARRMARHTATAASSVNLGASWGANGGRRTIVNHTPLANGENQPRASRPRPTDCSSATTTCPSGQPAAASFLASLLVDSTLRKYATGRPSRRVTRLASISAGSSRSGARSSR